jgi:hypothetical protein
VAAAGERDQRRSGDRAETSELNATQHARHNARCSVNDRSMMFCARRAKECVNHDASLLTGTQARAVRAHCLFRDDQRSLFAVGLAVFMRIC